MFDKQIHKDDFKLRLLLTNKCNKACKHCLNDFQPKGRDMLDPVRAYELIRPYCMFMRRKGLIPKVEFSGGEPGLHPFLGDMLVYAKQYGAFTKVNTNGLALRKSLPGLVDCWHVGVNSVDTELLRKIEKVKGQAQYVVTYDRVLYDLWNIVGHYKNVPLKLFMDFNAEEQEASVIETYIDYAIELHPDAKTRFVGIQENRGKLCQGCKKKCITLKALWVFPNGSISLCPQGEKRIWKDHKSSADLPDMGMLYNQHKVGDC